MKMKKEQMAQTAPGNVLFIVAEMKYMGASAASQDRSAGVQELDDDTCRLQDVSSVWVLDGLRKDLNPIGILRFFLFCFPFYYLMTIRTSLTRTALVRADALSFMSSGVFFQLSLFCFPFLFQSLPLLAPDSRHLLLLKETGNEKQKSTKSRSSPTLR